MCYLFFFFFKQKTAYEMRISDWSSDVCSSDLITLEEGEAWFQVAHDAHRPFVVDVGSVRIRAVGTAFSVRRNPEGVDVMVTEGVVETRSEERRVGKECVST